MTTRKRGGGGTGSILVEEVGLQVLQGRHLYAIATCIFLIHPRVLVRVQRHRQSSAGKMSGDMDQYLHYIGGPAGALALTGVAAASAYYLASRPTPEKPLVALDEQSYVIPGRDRSRNETLVD
ncbi:UNVERIFIED_CONTAM: hypothetical protein B566_EDAN015884 [Ephemera danica]|nr:hypothetical protein B566_EDAN015884 [Ephemera danica]